MDYYESTAEDPLEAVDEILRMLEYCERSELEFWNGNTGESVNVDNYTECTSPISFRVTLDGKDGQLYSLTGTIVNRGWNDRLLPVWDAGAELEPVKV